MHETGQRFDQYFVHQNDRNRVKLSRCTGRCCSCTGRIRVDREDGGNDRLLFTPVRSGLPRGERHRPGGLPSRRHVYMQKHTFPAAS